jgi:DNA processing protein
VSAALAAGITRRLVRGQSDYPRALLDLPSPPEVLTLSGEIREGRAIAIVGTRKPSPDAEAFARQLASVVVSNGGIAVSGGALGVDSATHEAALDAGGVTWMVAATGCNEVFPPKNAALFARIRAGGGVMIWPFEDGIKASPRTFFARNGVLAALAHALVIVQAGAPSGTLNAASWARRLGRPVWAVCAPPWMPEYVGCASAIERGARPLVSVASFLKAVGLIPLRRAPKLNSISTSTSTSTSTSIEAPTPPTPNLGALELRLLDLLSFHKSQHIDEIAVKSGLSTSVVTTTLLTLALENVVVESPEGFFSRQSRR